MAIFVCCVIGFPFAFPSGFAIGAAITVAGYAIGTVGFVLLLGLAHQLAIGQAAFYMLGGYGSAILTTRYGWDGASAAIVSMLAAVLVAAAVGQPLLKLSGFVLAIASLALHLLFIASATLLVGLTGGASGIPAVPRFSIGPWVLARDLDFYFFAWLLVGLTVIVGLNVDRSRIGRALRALAANEAGAVASGIDTTRYKLLIFVVSAGMASLGGSVIVHYLRVIDPTVFGNQFSLDVITAVIVGGLYSVWGAVIGAAVIVVLHELLRLLQEPAWQVIVMGGLTVVVLIAFPGGIVGAITRLFQGVFSPPDALVGDAPPAAMRTSKSGRTTDVLLRIEGLTRLFGKLRAVGGVGFEVRAGEIVALIGPNGAGKTTMLDMISGHQVPNGGRVTFCGRDITRDMPDRIAGLGIARTFQSVRMFGNMSVIENVMCGSHVFGRSGLAAISLGLPGVRAEERRLRAAAFRDLAFVGQADASSTMPGQVPFGHQRMIELARAMALEPLLLLLDEPASGLNDTETEHLANLLLDLRARGVTILLVEHDIRLVMGLADRIVVMDHGEKIAEGPPDHVRVDPQVVSAYLGVAA